MHISLMWHAHSLLTRVFTKQRFPMCRYICRLDLLWKRYPIKLHPMHAAISATNEGRRDSKYEVALHIWTVSRINFGKSAVSWRWRGDEDGVEGYMKMAHNVAIKRCALILRATATEHIRNDCIKRGHHYKKMVRPNQTIAYFIVI